MSPAKSNLEETISTLDYAFRAKNIRNKPQVNQMISKKTLLREFTTEIEKLKGELIATRQRNGVYLTTGNYEEIVGESESRKILSEEQKAKIETMEANLRNKVQELFSLTSNFNILKKDNEGTRLILDETKGVLEKTEIVLADTRQNLTEETTLRKAHQSTEEQLNNVGGELISTLERTVGDVVGLHSKIRRKSDLQVLNRREWQSSQVQVADVTKVVESRMSNFQREHGQLITVLADRMQAFVQEELRKLGLTRDFLNVKTTSFETSEKEVIEQTSAAKEDTNQVLEEIKVLREDVKQKVGEGLNGLSVAAGRISAEIINELGGFHTQVSRLRWGNCECQFQTDISLQLHTSYSSLGKDFKNIFEELVKHLNSQKLEADELRSKASSAVKAAMQADADASVRLEACLTEQRFQAAQDRRDMLSQITDLVNGTGERQESQWESKVNAIRDDIAASRSTLQSADSKYNDEMDMWSRKENLLVDEVLKSRDTLKGKIKKDWTVSHILSQSKRMWLTFAISRLLMSTMCLSRRRPSLYTKRLSILSMLK